MKKAPTYEELLVENTMLRDQNRRMNERIAYLERMLYGAKSDRMASKVPENQPGLFDEFFKEAMDEKAQHPSDMRIGVNGMCGKVRAVGLDPTNGDVYIFVGSSRKIMKLLHWERGGFAMYYKRLEQGRFHPRIFLRQGIGFRSMRWDELVLLMEGISPKVARRHRYVIEEKNCVRRGK